MSVSDFQLPVYALCQIDRHKITDLPAPYTFVKTVVTPQQGNRWHILTTGKVYCAVRCKGGDTVTYAPNDRLMLGYERKTLAEIDTIIHDDDSAVVCNKGPAENFTQSPTGITLNKTLPTYLRAAGVILKNSVTGEEHQITESINVSLTKLKLRGTSGNRLLYEGKMVNNWYIDRIDTTAAPLARGWSVDANSVGKVLVNGSVTVDCALPRGTICATTGLNRHTISRLINGGVKEVMGWSCKAKEVPAG